MKKKIVYFTILITLFGTILTGCSDKEVKQHNNTEKNQEQVFSLTYDHMNIELGSEFKVEKYGKENSYSEIESCAFEGLDKTYTYDHYEIYTYPENEKDYILSIYFLDEEIETTEGIKISDTYEDMTKTYGEDFKKEDNLYTYTKGKTNLKFIIENDFITSIEYTYDV